MSLKPIRDEIDKIDEQLIELFKKRMECSKKVAEYKVERGIPVLNEQREKEILEDVAKKSGKTFVKKIINQSISEIFYEWNFDNGKETELARIVYTSQGIYHLHIAKKGVFTNEEKAKYSELLKTALLQ